jgi:dienelactone hydrolase
VTSFPNIGQVGVIETGHGYRIRKLRYEIVPGFLSTALLYDRKESMEKFLIPAILNLLGHEPLGTAIEYEQKRCTNFAKRGMIALDPELPAFGDLSQIGNRHDFGVQLDLVGANDLGFFYLAMRQGLDYLETLPEVDVIRIGVTGLSGGGWQTVILSALDPRVTASVGFAGIGSRNPI